MARAEEGKSFVPNRETAGLEHRNLQEAVPSGAIISPLSQPVPHAQHSSNLHGLVRGPAPRFYFDKCFRLQSAKKPDSFAFQIPKLLPEKGMLRWALRDEKFQGKHVVLLSPSCLVSSSTLESWKENTFRCPSWTSLLWITSDNLNMT